MFTASLSCLRCRQQNQVWAIVRIEHIPDRGQTRTVRTCTRCGWVEESRR